MSEKRKTKDKNESGTAPESPVKTETKSAEQPKSEPVASAVPASKPTKPSVRLSTKPAASGPFNRAAKSKKVRKVPVGDLASATGVSRLVFAALKVAYRWTAKTRLTKDEFVRKHKEWLARPASEV